MPRLSAVLTAARPAPSHETLRPSGAEEAPLVALFESAARAEAAIADTGARLLRRGPAGRPDGTVITLAPQEGLRESLYHAGALLVVG